MISHNISQQERLVNLNESARRQMRVLKDNKGIKDLEVLQHQINNNGKVLVEKINEYSVDIKSFFLFTIKSVHGLCI